MGFYHLMGVDQPFDPTARFATSWLLPAAVLAGVRLLFSLYAILVNIVSYALAGDVVDRQSFSYFTFLTYWGITFYLLVAGLHSANYAWNLRRLGTRVDRRGYPHHGPPATYWLQRWPRPLQALHVLYYTTIIVFPPIVTIVYWAVLYRGPWFPRTFDQWSNISRHGLNSLVTILEVIFTRGPPPAPLHPIFIVLILALYLSLAYLTHYTEGFYPYSFLDPAQGAGKTAGYIIGILVATLIICLIVWLIIHLRLRLTEGSRARRREAEAVNAQELSGTGDQYAMAERGKHV